MLKSNFKETNNTINLTDFDRALGVQYLTYRVPMNIRDGYGVRSINIPLRGPITRPPWGLQDRKERYPPLIK